jgi:hypothetical protein
MALQVVHNGDDDGEKQNKPIIGWIIIATYYYKQNKQ